MTLRIWGLDSKRIRTGRPPLALMHHTPHRSRGFRGQAATPSPAASSGRRRPAGYASTEVEKRSTLVIFPQPLSRRDSKGIPIPIGSRSSREAWYSIVRTTQCPSAVVEIVGLCATRKTVTSLKGGHPRQPLTTSLVGAARVEGPAPPALIRAKVLIREVGKGKWEIGVDSVGNGVANQPIPPGQRGIVGSPPRGPDRTWGLRTTKLGIERSFSPSGEALPWIRLGIADEKR
jgi:hypothetical protein